MPRARTRNALADGPVARFLRLLPATEDGPALRGPNAGSWSDGPGDALALPRFLEREAALLSTVAAYLTSAGVDVLGDGRRRLPLLDALELVRTRLREPAGRSLVLHGERALLWHWLDGELYLAVPDGASAGDRWAVEHHVVVETFPERPAWLPEVG